MAEDYTLSRWEFAILSSIKKEAKSEKKIAKHVALNTLTTSQLITDLMSRGYIERTITKKRVRRYSYTEKFALTQEGLVILDEFTRQNNSWYQLGEFLRQETYELPLKMIIGTVKIAYKLAKFIVKP